MTQGRDSSCQDWLRFGPATTRASEAGQGTALPRGPTAGDPLDEPGEACLIPGTVDVP